MSRLTIYFTSDTHGYLYNTNFADTRPRPLGLLGMQFPKDGDTLIIDGGDTIQGSPLTYFLHEKHRRQIMADVMNARGYDVVTLGNHDFNYGPGWMGEYLHGLHASCLCANVEDLTGTLPIRKWEVRTMASGLKVGLFGITTHWINVWEKKENLQTFRITPPVPAAREAVRALQAAGCDKIIGIYHGGVEKDLETGRTLTSTDENEACRLCEELPIDLLLTGHQHIPFAGKSWHGTHVVQTPCYAKAYVRVDMADDGTFSSCLLTPPEEQTWTEEETAVRQDLESFLDSPVGHLSKDLWPGDRLQTALHGSEIADFFNRVQLWATGADVSCTALPNECRGFSRDVTVRDVVASYIYPNTLCVLNIRGSDLRAALEQCATYFDVDAEGRVRISDSFLKPKEEHYNYDFFAGIEYAFDLAKPCGSRVIRMERQGKPIADADEMTLCMCDYRATGAGNFPMWKACTHAKDVLTEISELILQYFAQHETVSVPESCTLQTFLGTKRL